MLNKQKEKFNQVFYKSTQNVLCVREGISSEYADRFLQMITPMCMYFAIKSTISCSLSIEN